MSGIGVRKVGLDRGFVSLWVGVYCRPFDAIPGFLRME